LRLVFLARLYQYQKRVLDLIPLCSGLVNANVDFRLTVVGDGPDRAAVEAGIRSIPGLGDRVQFLGWLSNSRALEVLRGQHVLLLLSEFEGQPIVMLEGMGCGVVPVVTDITAHREIIVPGQDGFLVPVGDISRFVATLLLLASDRGQLAASAEAAWRKTLATWHSSVAIAHLANLLYEVSQRPLPPQDGIAPISYPATRMSQLGIPHALQGVKRWVLRQHVIW
jgi:glycosyltransferase involved in cell wall biosynthesis